MPHEVWIRSNRRPALAVAIASAAVACAAIGVLVVTWPWQSAGQIGLASAAGVCALAAAIVAGAALSRTARARVVRRGAELDFLLGSSRSTSVPLNIVEAFFLGQGPAHLPGRAGDRLESVILVARLSQRATEWHHREVDPRLGAWCDGYVSVRGTHCEPLTTDLVGRLNRQLAEAKRESAVDA